MFVLKATYAYITLGLTHHFGKFSSSGSVFNVTFFFFGCSSAILNLVPFAQFRIHWFFPVFFCRNTGTIHENFDLDDGNFDTDVVSILTVQIRRHCLFAYLQIKKESSFQYKFWLILSVKVLSISADKAFNLATLSVGIADTCCIIMKGAKEAGSTLGRLYWVSFLF